MSRPTVEIESDQSGNRQKFRIAPLEPGFGHTIGNSLRRTLLSSVPGAAITNVRFDDALHEFTTLQGVKEDVTDVILNLKDVVVRSMSDEPVVCRIDKRGPGTVTSADIQAPSDIEVVENNVTIATLDDGARLAVDLTVSQGRGYLSADKNKSTTTIGIIPIDSIFTPVRRVSFYIEPTRVEQSTNFDALILDIETDGSITPRDALASAGATLRNLMGLISEMSELAVGLELGEIGQQSSGSPDMDLAIEELDLSERPRNCLKRAQVNTIGELLLKTVDDLLAITNFGQKSLDEVIAKLDERGLSLRTKGE